ncbi:hypothetical protein CAEBREN_07637 [Caenorhabditis brenneri]|uniref:Uncharacterized protein n=1 Tax=Caenorhabditis brenneri TaxID=135651 RepID=G0MHQ7_CAEBE|nr:hypothetical protein CAEBREN_07637 [Caenorhabditis brenneri]
MAFVWAEGDLAWYSASVVKLIERKPGRKWSVQYLGFLQNSILTVKEAKLAAFHVNDEYRVTGVATDRAAQAEGVRMARALLQPPNGPWQNGVAQAQPLDAQGVDQAQPQDAHVAPVQANEIVADPLPEPGHSDEVQGDDMAEPQELEAEEEQANAAPEAEQVIEESKRGNQLRRRFEEIEEDGIEEEHEVDEQPPAKRARVDEESWSEWFRSWFKWIGF